MDLRAREQHAAVDVAGDDGYVREPFTAEERAVLARHFTNVDGPVFALVGLPEVVKGALFARYSRSSKSLRRLFLDEFAADVPADASGAAIGSARAERLYDRVFFEYGDDSVAQLGGVHLACEQASQLLCKQLEWGRLAAYLEQSTRYMRYDDRPGGRWRATIPREIRNSTAAGAYEAYLDRAFGAYGRMFDPLRRHLVERFPRAPGDSEAVYRSTITAKACDALRGVLPAATRSNVGVYASGQAYEGLLIRMRAHPLSEVRDYGELILTELRKVIPAFLRRVDLPDRGLAWSRYLETTRRQTEEIAARYLSGAEPGFRDEVTLVDYDPDGEEKVVAAALYAASDLPDDRLHAIAHAMSADERRAVLDAYVGERANRRHKPGRAFERTSYRFDVLCDYGAFRDLQRHRPLTVEWQRLTPDHGFEVPPEIEDSGLADPFAEAMEDSARTYRRLLDAGLDAWTAQYAVSMAHRVRFVMQMNAREAMHVIELRSSPQGHPVYRRIAQRMHDLIREQAAHRAIAAAMSHVDRSPVSLERLDAERRAEERRRAPGRG